LHDIESKIIFFETSAREIKKVELTKLSFIGELKMELDRSVAHRTALQTEFRKI
jgi:hypothetical protein